MIDDYVYMARDRAGRRHTDRNGMWYFACGMAWMAVLMMIAGGI